MKRILFILAILGVAAGCGSSSSEDSSQVASVSENPEIQSAYENCVSQTRTELKSDNPDTPEDIMKFMYEGANQTCNSAVVATCNNDTKSQSCKLILDMYRG